MTEYKLSHAIMIYSDDNQNRHYLQLHDINHDTTPPTLLSGQPLDMKDVIELLKNTVSHNLNKLNVASPEILAYGTGLSNSIIWYTPPQIKNLFFSQSLSVPSGPAAIPGLIFFKDEKSLEVYAYKGKKPTLRSRLYKAPFPNISDNTVCLGSAKSQLDASNFKNWENTFFMTKFSEARKEKITRKTKDIRLFWRKLIKTKSQKFPFEELVPTKIHLKTLIEEYNATLSS